MATPTPSLEERIAACETRLDAITTDEVKDDQEVTTLSQLVAAVQSQLLWVCSGCILFGAGAGYVLERAFG